MLVDRRGCRTYYLLTRLCFEPRICERICSNTLYAFSLDDFFTLLKYMLRLIQISYSESLNISQLFSGYIEIFIARIIQVETLEIGIRKTYGKVCKR